jgi:hypothetical protein
VVGKISLADGVSPGDYISTYMGRIYKQALRMPQENSSCPDEDCTCPDERVHMSFLKESGLMRKVKLS